MITFDRPKKRVARFAAEWLGVVLLIANASAYELSTHALLTYQAFKQSDLRVGSPLYGHLGIDMYMAGRNAVLDSPVWDLLLRHARNRHPTVGS